MHFPTVNSKPVTAAGVAAGGTGAVGPATGKYIPPSQRGDKKPGERGESFGSRMQQDDQATVRVTNLSEETQESDLRELFGYFGQIKRVFLAKDKITQQSKVGVLMGENRTFMGEEALVAERGVNVTVLDDETCVTELW